MQLLRRQSGNLEDPIATSILSKPFSPSELCRGRGCAAEFLGAGAAGGWCWGGGGIQVLGVICDPRHCRLRCALEGRVTHPEYVNRSADGMLARQVHVHRQLVECASLGSDFGFQFLGSRRAVIVDSLQYQIQGSCS